MTTPPLILAWLAAASVALAADPFPSQPSSAASPPYSASTIGAPFPDNIYGADHGGSALSLRFPFLSRFGNLDHSRGVVTYVSAPFTPRRSEGVYGMDAWLEENDGDGNWHPARVNGGLADGAYSPYQPVNTPNPGPSPSFSFQWTFDATPLPPNAAFRVFVYVYLYNQGGGGQGNFYVASSAGNVSAGPANDPPRIAWSPSFSSTNPGQVAAGASYVISADAEDDNGNLASVTISKNGSPFAAAGPGDGSATTAAASSADGPGTIDFTAQAVDQLGALSPTIAFSVSVLGPVAQAAVSSSDATIDLGSAFAPAAQGGSGTGGWQFAIGGYSNWNGGTTADTGTEIPGGAWADSWTAPSAGSYAFWIVRDGDSQYLPSASAGPYTLTVQAPAPSNPPAPSPASTPPTNNTPPPLPPTPIFIPPPNPPLSPPPAPPPPVIPPNTPTYSLSTSTFGPGQITPSGGQYPAGAAVTVWATPNWNGQFIMWTGSQPGFANPVTITMNSDVNLTAWFQQIYTQTIQFAALPDATFPGPNVPLVATTSSGLTVSFQLAGGVGIVRGNTYIPTALGWAFIEADQYGTFNYFAAKPAIQRLHIVAPAAAAFERARIRFNLNGAAGGSAGPQRAGASLLSTDPAGLLVSPWPDFSHPIAAVPGPFNVPLPAPRRPSGP